MGEENDSARPAQTPVDVKAPKSTRTCREEILGRGSSYLWELGQAPFERVHKGEESMLKLGGEDLKGTE